MPRMSEGLMERARLLSQRKKNQAVQNSGAEVLGFNNNGDITAIGRLHPQSSTQSSNSPQDLKRVLESINPKQAGQALGRSSFAQEASSGPTQIDQVAAGQAEAVGGQIRGLLNADVGATSTNLAFAGSDADLNQRSSQDIGDRNRDVNSNQQGEDALAGQLLGQKGPRDRAGINARADALQGQNIGQLQNRVEQQRRAAFEKANRLSNPLMIGN